MLEFVHEVAGADDIEGFRAAVTFGIGDVVGADLASYTEVQLEGRRVLALMDRPIPEGLPAALGRLAHQHPLITRRSDDAQTVSDYLSEARFHGLELYTDVYRPLGAQDQLAINIRVRPGTVAGVALNRSRRNFTAADRANLSALRPMLLKAYRRAQARERARAWLEDGNREGAAVVALDVRGWVQFASDRARLLMRAYLPSPQRLLDWLEAGAPGRLTVAGQPGELDINLLPAHPGEYQLLELRERVREPQQTPLTPREREILERAARGASNKEIARSLQISRSTVENHLSAVYRKLGVANRTAAVAKANIG